MSNQGVGKSVFDQFTGKYSLSKTLRFELKPVGQTEQMLIEKNIIKLDESRKERYEKTKPFFDKLHQEFISDSLKDKVLNSLVGYDIVYQNWKADRKNNDLQKKLEKKENEIREEVVTAFNTKAIEWIEQFSADVKLKKKDHEFLFETAVFFVLQKKYGYASDAVVDGRSIFDSWDNWAAYFGKFFETRRNFYKSDGTATAVATRVVNDNLRRFCDNLKIFEEIKSKIDLSTLEKDFGEKLEKVFALKFYDSCLNQAGINTYNTLLGGETIESGQKVKGINEYINEHRQKTGEKLFHLKKLDKQIGSDRENFIDLIKDDTDLKEVLVRFIADAKEKDSLFEKCVGYLLSEDQINFSGVYFRKEAINTIIRRWFASHERISDGLVTSLKQAGEKNAKFDSKSEEYKFPDLISWQVIKSAIESLANDKEALWKEHYVEALSLRDLNPWQQFLAVFKSEYSNLRSGASEKDGKSFNELSREVEVLLSKPVLGGDEEATAAIKSFLDRALNIYRFAKYFSLEKSRQWNPTGMDTDDFYVEYEQFYRDGYEKIVKVYDMVRNYITKKPFNQNKWKLNFENPTLANGWDQNKETDNTAVLLRKDAQYYLGVMDKKHNSIFRKFYKSSHGYEKIVYKLFPDPAKMMPKVCFSKKGLEFFCPSDDILRIYKNSEFKKGDTFSVASMQKLIGFYKEALVRYEGWKGYEFLQVKDCNEYTGNIGEFYRDVAANGYKITFEYVSDEYINQMNGEAKLYLFEIHNKDWNFKDGKQKTGAKNAHTLYFEQVFSNQNAKNNFVMKLNGAAELFFRPATDAKKLGKRKDKNGKMVVKNRRYAQDKIFFHIPITLNRTAPDSRKFNQSINELLANSTDINVIGIDRGEKHLAYLSVVNQKGEILETKSLNTINGIDYAQLLEERAKNRENARRDWKNVEQIKDLKRGYVSAVVREIADLIIKYNAIVVFEDLNMRFKQVRGGIEKSVYQQLEKALIDKLNFLVNKNEIDEAKAGHVLRAYQLTAPFESFKDMGKQTGVLFYTQAEYTSQTDPVTGFRKNVYVSNAATVEKIKEFIGKFDAIGWDEKLQSYCWDYNPINFVEPKFRGNTISKDWRVYANVPRIKRERRSGYWETVAVNPNDEFSKLFGLWKFDNPKGEIQDQIFQMYEEGRLDGTQEFDGKKRNFWQSFIFLFNLVLQVRNSTATQYKKDEEGNIVQIIKGVDFISSPALPFFTTDGGKYTDGFVNLADMETRFIGDNTVRGKFKAEFNGDANGSYNIARKGIMILKRIGNNSERPDLFISKKDWAEYAQKIAE